MRLVFVNWAYESHGSAQDLFHYVRVARQLGHEVTLYGKPDPASAFNYSLEVGRADAVVFIFEFTTRLTHGEKMGFCRMIGNVPRNRRVVIDCDGKYNDAIDVDGDTNHRDAAASRQWTEICDSLADKIFQPTWHPLYPNVRPFFFHAYDPSWEQPLDFGSKPYGMVYVGNNWFRWGPMQRVLQAIEPIRPRVGRLGVIGFGWNELPFDHDANAPADAYQNDPAFLRRLRVEVMPPVRFDQVIPWMGRGVFSPVIYRPLFDNLRLATCRTFETPAANTIPLFCQDDDFIREIYGEVGLELRLSAEKIVDLFARPRHYLGVVREIRQHLAKHYSYKARFKELIELICD
jgi:hypothetical protein